MDNHDILLLIIVAVIPTIFAILGYFLRPLVDPMIKAIAKKEGFLLYDIRKYGDYCIVAIWNPTNINITNEAITKEFETCLYGEEIVIKPLRYTNKKLKDILVSNNDSDIINLNFENFSGKSAIVFISNSYHSIERLLESGAINNNKLKNLDSFIGEKIYDSLFVRFLFLCVMGICLWYLFKFLGLEMNESLIVFLFTAIMIFYFLLNKCFKKYMYVRYSISKEVKEVFDGKMTY